MAKTVKKKPVVRPAARKIVKPAPKPKAPKQEWATKEDLRPLATKTMLAKLVTKDELAGLASKEEIANLPGKEDMLQLDDRIGDIEKNLSMLDKKIELLASQMGDNPAALNRLQSEVTQIRETVSELEMKVAEKPTAGHEVLEIENRVNDHETRLRNLEGVQ